MPLHERIALYSIADCAVVTCTRDGMNLVPYEARANPESAEPGRTRNPRNPDTPSSGSPPCWVLLLPQLKPLLCRLLPRSAVRGVQRGSAGGGLGRRRRRRRRSGCPAAAQQHARRVRVRRVLPLAFGRDPGQPVEPRSHRRRHLQGDHPSDRGADRPPREALAVRQGAQQRLLGREQLRRAPPRVQVALGAPLLRPRVRPQFPGRRPRPQLQEAPGEQRVPGKAHAHNAHTHNTHTQHACSPRASLAAKNRPDVS